MNKLCDVASFANVNRFVAAGWRHTQMALAIQVLSVGRMDRSNLVHDALLNGRGFHLTIATDYRELWGMPTQESIQLAIVHNTLSAFETEAACRLIRRRWPHCGILVVHRGEGILDNSLYDDRVAPTAAPEVLLTIIGRLTETRDERRFGIAEL
jgi:hypothetical protein